MDRICPGDFCLKRLCPRFKLITAYCMFMHFRYVLYVRNKEIAFQFNYVKYYLIEYKNNRIVGQASPLQYYSLVVGSLIPIVLCIILLLCRYSDQTSIKIIRM